jgi:hypothetical protein
MMLLLLLLLLLLISSVTLIAVSFLIEYLCNVFKLIYSVVFICIYIYIFA